MWYTFTADDLDRILSETDLEKVEFHPKLPSTNDRAAELVKTLSDIPPCLVLTEYQTAGRGRHSNHWWSGPGSLTFSFVCDVTQFGLTPKDLPQLSLATALAVRAGLSAIDASCVFQVKWPNDVYLHSKKVAGLLLESTPKSPNTLIVGVGINVNNSILDAPQELQTRATSVFDVTGHRFELANLLIQILHQISSYYRRLSNGKLQVQPEWQPHCLLTGRDLRLQLGSQQVNGRCQGVDQHGALLLYSDGHTKRFFSGTIEHFE